MKKKANRWLIIVPKPTVDLYRLRPLRSEKPAGDSLQDLKQRKAKVTKMKLKDLHIRSAQEMLLLKCCSQAKVHIFLHNSDAATGTCNASF
jgi:hypothetical protein